MGLLLAKLYSLYERFGSDGNPSRILMLGLDAAGNKLQIIILFTAFLPLLTSIYESDRSF